jgi:hypothetical protein
MQGDILDAQVAPQPLFQKSGRLTATVHAKIRWEICTFEIERESLRLDTNLPLEDRVDSICEE